MSFDAVGKRIPRVEGPEKVTGAAQYVADLKLPGMLVGKVLRSPYPHARILRIDTSKAAGVPGVKAVITAEDTPKIRWGAFIKDLYPLAVGKVRYVGDEVAAVAATTEDAAREALGLIEVEYEPLPAILIPQDAVKEGAILIHDDIPGNLVLDKLIHRGDVDEGFRQADVVVEGNFKSPLQYHAWIEPIGSIARWSPTGKLLLYMNTQTLFMARQRIAYALGIGIGDVRIIQPHVGAGFGGKSCDDNNAIVCSLLAKRAGRPVKLINAREDEFLASRPRVPSNIFMRLGFTRDGHVIAKETDVLNDNGAYSAKAPATTRVTALRHDIMYRHVNVRTRVRLAYTNNIPTGAFRGFGNPAGHWAVESLMDMAAVELGIDPAELRLINGVERGDVTVHGNIVRSCALKECVRRAVDLSDWNRKKADKVPHRGIGLATMVHVSGRRHFGDFDGASAIVKVNEDGKVFIMSGEGDTGQGAFTVFCQIAAEELGVPVSDVSISAGDTDMTTFCQGNYASRLTYIGGNAVRRAAAACKRQILEQAAQMLMASPEALRIKDGKVYIEGSPEKFVTVGQAAWARLYRRGGEPIVGFGAFDPPSEMQDQDLVGNESGAYTFGCQIAEVEVDPETGKVDVVNFVAVNDAGQVINPTLAEGQQEGALGQGIGWSLTEGLVFEDGQPMNPNFHEYKLPVAQDMPRLKTDFVGDPEPTGPFGAKGLGEPGMVPTGPAIANAVFDAVGVRIDTLPLSAEKVYRALQAKAQRKRSRAKGG